MRTAALWDWDCSLCCHILSCFVSHRLFHEHIQRLSKVVTANHKALQVPEVSPWWHYFSSLPCICVDRRDLLVHVALKIVGHSLSFFLFTSLVAGLPEGGPLALCTVWDQDHQCVQDATRQSPVYTAHVFHHHEPPQSGQRRLRPWSGWLCPCACLCPH